MSNSALRFRGVTKTFGSLAALDDLSLEVPAGGVFGLVGENGAGKTTLIKCLLDFCDIDRGAIDIYDRSHRVTAARARLAFLPERFNPPFYLTGRDFLRYLGRLHGVAYDEARVGAMFAALDLAPSALERPARTYSKGMTQKLGLAACLLSGKDLYLLDEPTSGLDPKARARLKRELEKLRTAGRTVFLTSHSLADVAEMCDGMAVVHQGRLRFRGTPEAFVREFDAPDMERAYLACIGATADVP